MASKRIVAVARDLPLPDVLWQQLHAAVLPDELVVFDSEDRTSRLEALNRAEIAIVAGDSLDDDLLAAPNLKWVHCDHAGLDRSARPEVFAKGLIVTGSAGRSAPALAEHAMLFCLALTSGFRLFVEAQRRHEWLSSSALSHLGALYARTIGIIGLGHTGCELAIRAKAFGLTVLGYRRKQAVPPPGVDRVFAAHAGEGPGALLEQSDIVVLTTSLSNATHKLIDAAALERMKPTAFLINLARGEVVDQEALINALKQGQIAGAGLDVTDPEPLPSENPLWDLPNVLITPHFTAPIADRRERSLRIILENLERYRKGEILLNRLQSEDVWTPAF